MIYPQKKRFGQNFLTDTDVIERIISTINPLKKDNLLEIGIGMGALTLPLLKIADRLNLIELDRDLVAYWRLKKYSNLVIYQADILKFDLSQLPDPLRIIGNLPYNISSPILFKMLHNRHLISDLCFMLQQEVAQRISAKPSSKSYGRLSVMLQAYFDITYCFNVNSNAFKPMPKVQSAIVRLIPKSPAETIDFYHLEKIVRLSFAMRRKTLKNCLKSYLSQQQTKIDLSRRAQSLSVGEFFQLTKDYINAQY